MEDVTLQCLVEDVKEHLRKTSAAVEKLEGYLQTQKTSTSMSCDTSLKRSLEGHSSREAGPSLKRFLEEKSSPATERYWAEQAKKDQDDLQKESLNSYLEMLPDFEAGRKNYKTW